MEVTTRSSTSSSTSTKPALGTGIRLCGRQGRQRRPRQITRDRRPAAGDERAVGGRDRLYRAAAAHLLPLVKAGPPISKLEPARSGQIHDAPQLDAAAADQAKIKQALWYALQQGRLPEATVGNADYYKVCKTFYPCGTPMATGREWKASCPPIPAKSQELLKEAGYDGTPIVLMASTDLPDPDQSVACRRQLMERGGFKVDMQSMDWQTLVARRARRIRRTPAAGTYSTRHGSPPTSSTRR